MSPEPKRKPRTQTKPYERKERGPKTRNAPKTSAKTTIDNRRSNLTLHNWLTVFAWMKDYPDVSQEDVVNHFKTRKEGALIFTQSTLSQKLKAKVVLEARAETNPTALSSKRPRVVTRPDVERALVLWCRHMENKGEQVNGPMLKAKRVKFEEKFDVPEEERLTGDG
ncbi:hypothetical protein V5O48_010155 [Marasmius crinis-equi]|uniref:HTH CENPB-type domain-containing protein n=1 Tax=Marasmius crinis-equi TaxID=585013 RepID=A0ABR3F998_9AGAR